MSMLRHAQLARQPKSDDNGASRSASRFKAELRQLETSLIFAEDFGLFLKVPELVPTATNLPVFALRAIHPPFTVIVWCLLAF
ncbi:hypothetical protein C1J02_18155 [Sulfitobacter sp. SK011]|nr:hypothetical protein C1J02_18155 [Sulfitobacter sp. SK011]